MSEAPSPKPRYLTKAGYDLLQAELKQLLLHDRPKTTEEVSIAAAHGDRSENYEYKLGKRKLREMDAKIHRLQKILDTCTVVDPATRPKTKVAFFGATVTIEDEDGEEATYQLVGSDELDPRLGSHRISYEAPLGQALLGKKEGQSFQFRRPAGTCELTILKVEWV